MFLKKLIVLVCVAASVSSWASPLPNKPHIYVEGSAVIDVQPDIATFTVYLESVSENSEKSKTDIDKKSLTLVKLCKALDIDTADVAASPVHVRKEFEYSPETNKNEYIGVNVSRTVEVTLRDISKYKDVMHNLVISKISENIDTALRVSNERAVTDKALMEALSDATQRAQSIADLQKVKLGKVYSVSEFNLRQPERYLLNVSRQIEGQMGSGGGLVTAESDGAFSNVRNAKSLQRVSNDSLDPFDSGSMKATAQVFVVFLVK